MTKTGSPPDIRITDTYRVPNDRISRAGILPFIAHGERIEGWEVLVRRPPGLQLWEIAKGKRRVLENGQWRDAIKGETLARFDRRSREYLYNNALREGEDELGLKRDNVLCIYDTGDYPLKVSLEGRSVPLPLRTFAVAVADPADFNAPSKRETAEVCWMTLERFFKEGKPAQVPMVHKMLKLAQCERFKGAVGVARSRMGPESALGISGR